MPSFEVQQQAFDRTGSVALGRGHSSVGHLQTGQDQWGLRIRHAGCFGRQGLGTATRFMAGAAVDAAAGDVDAVTTAIEEAEGADDTVPGGVAEVAVDGALVEVGTERLLVDARLCARLGACQAAALRLSPVSTSITL